MSRGVLAIFSNINTASHETLKTFTGFYEMPFITMTHPVHKYDYRPLSQTSIDYSNFDDVNRPVPEVQSDEQVSSASVSSKKSNASETFLLNMHPDMVPLLVSMIKYNRWKNVYYIYDHEEGTETKKPRVFPLYFTT